MLVSLAAAVAPAAVVLLLGAAEQLASRHDRRFRDGDSDGRRRYRIARGASQD